MRKTKHTMITVGAWLAALSAAMACGPAFAATVYTYAGTNYTTFYDNCTPPGDSTAGPCVAYTGTMHASGSFTLDIPLPANFGPADISARSDLRWSFFDGVNTYSSADTAHALAEPGGFVVQTDASGVPVYSGTVIGLDLWQTVPGANNYIDFLNIGYRPYSPPVGDYANTGWKCFAVTGNLCTTDNYGANIANAASSAAGLWSVTAVASPSTATAPSLGRLAVAMLLAALATAGCQTLRRMR
jgi:hypothetical protein